MSLRKALVVGISEYPGEKNLPILKNAATDANAIADILDKYGDSG